MFALQLLMVVSSTQHNGQRPEGDWLARNPKAVDGKRVHAVVRVFSNHFNITM